VIHCNVPHEVAAVAFLACHVKHFHRIIFEYEAQTLKWTSSNDDEDNDDDDDDDQDNDVLIQRLKERGLKIRIIILGSLLIEKCASQLQEFLHQLNQTSCSIVSIDVCVFGQDASFMQNIDSFQKKPKLWNIVTNARPCKFFDAWIQRHFWYQLAVPKPMQLLLDVIDEFSSGDRHAIHKWYQILLGTTEHKILSQHAKLFDLWFQFFQNLEYYEDVCTIGDMTLKSSLKFIHNDIDANACIKTLDNGIKVSYIPAQIMISLYHVALQQWSESSARARAQEQEPEEELSITMVGTLCGDHVMYSVHNHRGRQPINQILHGLVCPTDYFGMHMTSQHIHCPWKLSLAEKRETELRDERQSGDSL
jgi:hypothetical protein